MSTVDPLVRTSRVFEATLAVLDRLLEQTFPDDPLGGPPPQPRLFRVRGDEEREYVVVLAHEPDPADNDTIEAGPMGRDERIFVEVLIGAMFPEVDASDPNLAARRVVERLWALADVVQGAAYDLELGKPRPFGFTNERTRGSVVSVSYELGATTEGVVGQARVRFALFAQI